MLNFNIPTFIGTEKNYVLQAMQSKKISGNGKFTKICESWFEEQTGCVKSLLTPSCTAALEIAAILLNIQPGDEVIMPSFTFVSTANAFVLRGAKIIFVDINPDTMNIDESKIEKAITKKAKAIVPVHYAGVGCDMDKIMSIADQFKIFVVEDAAQAVMSSYKASALGSIGHLGTFSFHETKNFTSGGEGGLLLLNDKRFIEKAEIIREKGTNRSKFLRGQVDKYSWVDIGSSFLASELQAAYLWGQLEEANSINQKRLKAWRFYYKSLSYLEELEKIKLPRVPKECKHNGHIFYLKLKDIDQRDAFINHLKSDGISSVFHYVPLHSSSAGKNFGFFNGEDKFTSIESERIVRLPIYHEITKNDQNKVIKSVTDFFKHL